MIAIKRAPSREYRRLALSAVLNSVPFVGHGDTECTSPNIYIKIGTACCKANMYTCLLLNTGNLTDLAGDMCVTPVDLQVGWSPRMAD